MKSTFYSNGKLLLTAEYLVLDGAKALAIPTKYGQTLTIKNSSGEGLKWKSLDENGAVWFEDTITLNKNKFTSKNTSSAISQTLIAILTEAKKLNPQFLENNPSLEITTSLDFNRNWGLGSSSTLIHNIALWSQTDAFKLLKRSFGGSGYDIACAGSDTALIYSNAYAIPRIESLDLKWDFKDELFFVYLNKKQDSKEGISKYKDIAKNKEAVIASINTLTKRFMECETLNCLEKCIEEHEELIASLLDMPKVKDTFFPDYPGSIKSLGAWGGDFILATSESAKTYFKQKGYNVVIPFNEMLLS